MYWHLREIIIHWRLQSHITFTGFICKTRLPLPQIFNEWVSSKMRNTNSLGNHSTPQIALDFQAHPRNTDTDFPKTTALAKCTCSIYSRNLSFFVTPYAVCLLEEMPEPESDDCQRMINSGRVSRDKYRYGWARRAWCCQQMDNLKTRQVAWH